MLHNFKSRRLMTISQTAEHLNCSEATVYTLIKKGALMAVSVGTAKGYRIDPRDLEQFIESRKTARQSKNATQKLSRPRLKHITI